MILPCLYLIIFLNFRLWESQSHILRLSFTPSIFYFYFYFKSGVLGEGFLACNHIKEASNAVEDEEHRVVDEEETLASRIQAPCP